MLTTYSFSALNTFRSCPRKFRFQYVEKADVPRRVTADTFLGNVVHRVLRRLYQLGSDGIVYPPDDMIAFYRQQWETVEREHLVLTDEFHTVDDYIQLGTRMLTTHYEHYRPFNLGTLLGTELRLRFSVAGTPFRFLAIIDRLWRRDDGVIEICDYKTGRHLTQPSEPAFLYQMGLYQLAVQQSYPQFQQVDLAQYFLRMNEVIRYRMPPDKLDSLTEGIRTAVVETLQAERLDDFPATEGPHCHYCDYVALCPAKRHRLMLEKHRDLESEDQPDLMRRARQLATQYLDTWQQTRESKARLDTLKEELVQLARAHDLSRIEGESGHVVIRVGTRERFVNRTDDDLAFADLVNLARQLHLDDYFTLDAGALWKEAYSKQRLDPDVLERLRRFVVTREDSRITARPDRTVPPDEEDT